MYLKIAISALFLGTLVGCSLDHGPFSGLRINGGNSRFTADISEYRVTASNVVALPKYEIPNTFYFVFNWSPQKARQIHRALGYRAVQEEDIDNLFGRPAIRTHKREAIEALKEAMADSDYEYVVAPNGGVISCGNRHSARWCPPLPTLSDARAKNLAQIVLSKAMPECRIGQLRPPAVTQLANENQYSLPSSLLAEVICST
ncbi:hypothetical protein [Planktotalea sp.]|uniref:hypothetical protein n=1 Tax=Planktotalea sp. TaxID=2029877 RepID=UPI0032984EFD